MYKYLGVKSEKKCYIMDVDTCDIRVAKRDHIVRHLDSLSVDYELIRVYADYKEKGNIDFDALRKYVKRSKNLIIGHIGTTDIDCYVINGILSGLNIPVPRREQNRLYRDTVCGDTVYSLMRGNTVYVHVNNSLYTLHHKYGFTQVGKIQDELVILACSYEKSRYYNDYALHDFVGRDMSLRDFKRQALMGVSC